MADDVTYPPMAHAPPTKSSFNDLDVTKRSSSASDLSVMLRKQYELYHHEYALIVCDGSGHLTVHTSAQLKKYENNIRNDLHRYFPAARSPSRSHDDIMIMDDSIGSSGPEDEIPTPRNSTRTGSKMVQIRRPSTFKGFTPQQNLFSEDRFSTSGHNYRLERRESLRKNSLESDDADGRTDSTSSGQSSQHTHEPMELGNEKARDQFFESRLEAVQQLNLKTILKAWIKQIEPKKQSKHPYQKKKAENSIDASKDLDVKVLSDEGTYLGASSKREMANSSFRSGSVGEKAEEKAEEGPRPPWWPEDIIHKEPDHSTKTDRMKLCHWILRMYRRPEAMKHISALPKDKNWVENLESATKDMMNNERLPDQNKRDLIAELYRVAKLELRLIEGDMDGGSTFYVQKLRKESRKGRKRGRRASSASTSASAKKRRNHPSQGPTLLLSSTGNLDLGASSKESQGRTQTTNGYPPSPASSHHQGIQSPPRGYTSDWPFNHGPAHNPIGLHVSTQHQQRPPMVSSDFSQCGPLCDMRQSSSQDFHHAVDQAHMSRSGSHHGLPAVSSHPGYRSNAHPMYNGATSDWTPHHSTLQPASYGSFEHYEMSPRSAPPHTHSFQRPSHHPQPKRAGSGSMASSDALPALISIPHQLQGHGSQHDDSHHDPNHTAMHMDVQAEGEANRWSAGTHTFSGPGHVPAGHFTGHYSNDVPVPPPDDPLSAVGDDPLSVVAFHSQKHPTSFD